MAELPSLEETIDLMNRLGRIYTVAELAEAANISGGANLKQSTVENLARITERLGIDVMPAYQAPESSAWGAAWNIARPVVAAIPNYMPVSGFVAVATRFLTASATYLRGAAAGTLNFLAKNPALTIGALAVGGTLYTVHNWLTQDERMALSRDEQTAEVLKHAFDGLPKKDRAEAFARVAGQLGARTASWNVWTVAGLALAGYLVYRAVRK